MTRRLTPTGLSAWLLVAVGLVAAVLLRTPGAMVVTAPVLLLLVVDLAIARPVPVQVVARPSTVRVLAGDRFPLHLHLDVQDRTTRRVALSTSNGLAADTGTDGLRIVAEAGRSTFTVDLIARRWGLASIHDVVLHWTSPLRTLAATTRHPVEEASIRILPRPEVLRAVRPRRTSGWAGLQTAAHTGRGTEFAELRPFAPGDRPRDVHWPTTLRRAEPWVTARHPDRGGVVVLALDLFDPVLLPFVVRTALQLVAAHHRARDRIGVVGLGGVVTWVAPGGGERHRAALVDQIIESQFIPTWVTRSVDHLPPHALPPDALVMAVASLGDAMSSLARGFRGRGHEVVLLDLERPVVAHDVDTADHVAARLLRLSQHARRAELTSIGVTVVGHDITEPLEHALARARHLRRPGRAA